MFNLTESEHGRAMGCSQSTCNSDTPLATAPLSFHSIIKRYLFYMLTYLMFVLAALPSPRSVASIIPLRRVPTDLSPEQNEIQIVQASLLGSILANLLLILGMCFLFGGLRFREQVTQDSPNNLTID
jgi:hypothetical protein